MIQEDSVHLEIRNQNLRLLPEKALFWENKSGLIISDVHLGKAGHFRKHGIALPQKLNDKNLELIDNLILRWSPKWILFLGDLFHSEKNEEWESFKTWRTKYSEIDFYLVMGNHELYPEEDYRIMGITCSKTYDADPFLFIHDENEFTGKSDRLIISGHVHPAVRLNGKGKQSVRLPCFFVDERRAILPAFGSLTGNYTLKPSKRSQVYGIIDNQILQIQ